VKVIIDTNVFISGIVFAGVPGKIIEAWLKGLIQPVVSLDILEEYRRVASDLGRRYKVNIGPFLEKLAIESPIWNVPSLPNQICSDPDDDKFLACALATGIKFIISGDKALLDTSGFSNINVLKPRVFVDRYILNT